jgi:hypothetical protein
MGAQRMATDRAYVEIFRKFKESDTQVDAFEKIDEYPTTLSPTACVETFIKGDWEVYVTSNRAVILTQGPNLKAVVTRLRKA